MILAVPYPAELLRVARKVVSYNKPEQTLADLKTFLSHLMVYGSSADVAVAKRYVPVEEFRRVLENASAGVFTREAWQKWHEQFNCGASLSASRVVRCLFNVCPTPVQCGVTVQVPRSILLDKSSGIGYR